MLQGPRFVSFGRDGYTREQIEKFINEHQDPPVDTAEYFRFLIAMETIDYLQEVSAQLAEICDILRNQ